MKKLIIALTFSIIGYNLNAQNCYTVGPVYNKTENPDLNSKRFTFGVKQIAEELLGEKVSICDAGDSIVINIVSIEAPSIGINIGPFMIKKKINILKRSNIHFVLVILLKI